MIMIMIMIAFVLLIGRRRPSCVTRDLLRFWTIPNGSVRSTDYPLICEEGVRKLSILACVNRLGDGSGVSLAKGWGLRGCVGLWFVPVLVRRVKGQRNRSANTRRLETLKWRHEECLVIILCDTNYNQMEK